MILKPVILGKSTFENNPGKKYTKPGAFYESLDRITWRGRTSDAIGNSFIPDGETRTIDDTLSLIRMKIQEKCKTAQELQHAIRRLKIAENKNVTPNIFRVTLLKFGIVLPQGVVDEVFNVFDKQRRGTMEFDDFCTWVMSAEFDPHNPAVRKTLTSAASKDYLTKNPLRSKLQAYHSATPFKEDPQMHMTFLDLATFLASKKISASERDIRLAFVQCEPKHCGYIVLYDLLVWADIPIDPLPERTEYIDVKTAVHRICGRKTILIDHVFHHIARNQGIRMGYDEFKRCIVSGGLGANVNDIRNLFIALGGQNERGQVNMDVLFHSLVPYAPDPALDKVADATENHFRASSAAAADRLLRNSIRKSYKSLRHALEAADRDSSGFIDAETLYSLINSLLTPISFQDFRLVTRSVKTDDRGRLAWAHFLSMYYSKLNDRQSNSASGASSLVSSLPMLPSSFSSSLLSDTSIVEVFPSRAQTAPVMNMTMTTSGSTTGAIAVSPVKVSQRRDLGLGNLSQSLGNEALRAEIKRRWQPLIRECQAVDNDRVGSLPKSTFVSIILKGVGLGVGVGSDKTFSNADVEELADQFKLGGREVDYGNCIRSCLGGSITGTPKANVRTLSPEQTLQRTKPAEGSVTISVQQQLQASHRIAEDAKVLSKFDPKVIAVCTKIVITNKALISQLKQACRDNQLSKNRGGVLQSVFNDLLKQFSIEVTGNDKATLFKTFRVAGVPDSFQFDEFFKLCSACKSSTAASGSPV